MRQSDRSLKSALDNLLKKEQNVQSTISTDPIQFAHRYADQRTRELAAIFASFLAFGRVSLFLPVIQKWMTLCDERGGPRQAVDNFSSNDIDDFNTLSYRWNKPPDFVLVMFTFKHLLMKYDTVGELIESLYEVNDQDLNDTLTRLISTIEGYAVTSAAEVGLNLTTFRRVT